MLHIDSKICAPNPNNLGDAYQEFLCFVANGAERAHGVGKRTDFIRRYGDWFPPFERHHDSTPHEAYYRDVINWWKTGKTELPLEKPDAQFGLHAVILRRKLRLIWLLADSGDIEEAIRRVEQLSTHYYRWYILDPEGGPKSEARLRHLRGACGWLRGNVEKLRVCKNPNCQQEKYFFQYKNRKYCSTLCYAEAETLRREERARANPKEYKRSPAARKNMSQSALRRWEEERSKRGLKRGERGAGQTRKKGRHG